MKCLPTAQSIDNVVFHGGKNGLAGIGITQLHTIPQQFHHKPPHITLGEYLTRIWGYMAENVSLSEPAVVKPTKEYLDFVKIKDDMLEKASDIRDKQTIKTWLRINNIELFNWMLNTEEGKDVIKYIQKYGRLGVYKAEKLFADQKIEKKDIATKLRNSNPTKVQI